MANIYVSVIIPAHNEEKIIEDTLKSIINQTHKPNKIIVACDNCTDNTIPTINKFKNETNENIVVFETINNKNKKAGALNQVFRSINIKGYILVMDADTVIDKNAIKAGVKALSKDNKLGAVCSRAGIMDCTSNNIYQKLLWSIQHIEYGSFDSHRVETENKIKVAHGMATLFKAEALKSVPSIRSSILGIESKDIYLEDNLVEDYEMTLCLKHNWKVSSCMDMLAFTDVPLSLKELFIQRIRWLRGGVDTLRLHPINKVTSSEILNHLLFVFLTILRVIVSIAAIQYIYLYGVYGYAKVMMVVVALCYIDSIYRLKYVQSMKKIDYVVKFLLIPEILYNWFQAVALIVSYALSFLNIKQKW